MKLLLFSDLHTDVAAARRLVDQTREADVAVGAGDFANVRRGVSKCIEVLKEIKAPTVLVPGNNESYEELVAACAIWPTANVLHGTGIDIAGVPFFGIGGKSLSNRKQSRPHQRLDWGKRDLWEMRSD